MVEIQITLQDGYHLVNCNEFKTNSISVIHVASCCIIAYSAYSLVHVLAAEDLDEVRPVQCAIQVTWLAIESVV